MFFLCFLFAYFMEASAMPLVAVFGLVGISGMVNFGSWTHIPCLIIQPL